MSPADLPPPRDPLRHGVALAVVVLITMALAILAHAALLLAHTEALVARADARRVQGSYRAAAELAAAERGLDSLPGSGALQAGQGTAGVMRLSGELALLLAEVSGVGSGEARARLLYAPDPATRVARRRAGIVAGAGVIRLPGALLGTAVDSDCPPEAPVFPLLPVWGIAEPAVPHPALGPIPLPALVSRLPARAPGELGVDSALAAGIPGDARVLGQGRVVLAVEGDLVLGSGTALSGWLWVGGELAVEAGARFHGVADVGSVLRLAGTAEFHVDPCVAFRALRAAPDLRRPWGIGPLAWPAQ